MKPRPRAALEVIEAEFAFQLLIVASMRHRSLPKRTSGAQRCRPRQGREIELGRCRLAARPLTHEPDLRARSGAFRVTMGEMHADGGKARRLLPTRAFAPVHFQLRKDEAVAEIVQCGPDARKCR